MDICSALARYAIVHTGIANQVERLGSISESHSPTRSDAQCEKYMWLHRSHDSVHYGKSNGVHFMFDIDSRSIFLHEQDAVGRFLKICVRDVRIAL